MRRADRLFAIVQKLGRRRLTTAARLAEELAVSERTIYRDVADLVGQGVPILGEAGVGYRLDKDFFVPPLMFDESEIQALVLGARMVETWADDDLRAAAQRVLEKVEVALPRRLRHRVEDTVLFSLSFRPSALTRANLGAVRRAIDGRRVIRFAYTDEQGRSSERTVRPLGLYFWGTTWTVAAWCELRRDFRGFRVDRMAGCDVEERTFALESPVTLDEYRKAMEAQGERSRTKLE
jgi:predicted DNA-binding transcriptional regulator YafY